MQSVQLKCVHLRFDNTSLSHGLFYSSEMSRHYTKMCNTVVSPAWKPVMDLIGSIIESCYWFKDLICCDLLSTGKQYDRVDIMIA